LVCIPIVSAQSNIILAQGDTFEFPIPYGQSVDQTTVWFFSQFGVDHLYDIPITYSENGVGFINLTENQTESFDPGSYKIGIQTVGNNKIKEVKYEERYNASLQQNQYLVSPFKGIEDIDINGWQPNMVLDKLQSLISTSFDDQLTIINLSVELPLTSIDGLDQIDDNKAELYGHSNLMVGTPIKILWDSERLISAQDYRLNTFYTSIHLDNESRRVWNTTIYLNYSIQELPTGKHWVDIIANNKTTRVGFNVGEFFKNQTAPPMAKIKYINDGVVVTPTPVKVEVPIPYEVTVIKTVVIPTQPFPKNALGEVYNPSIIPDYYNTRFNLLGGCAAVCIIGGLLWRLR